MIEHIYAYITGYYRKWEIEKYGQMDLNGIYRAPKEYVMQVIEIFIDCIIFGYSINSLMKSDYESFHREVPIIHYWILIDCILMFFTIFYVYLV